MNSVRARLTVVLAGLLVCGVAAGSVRMDGMGPGLSGLVDDYTSDAVTYPQLSALSPGWLVGVEMNKWEGFYHPYVRASGRWSVAAALDATLKDSVAYCDPSLALATRFGSLSLGAAATIGFLDEPRSRPEPDSWIYSFQFRNLGVAGVGARWCGPGFTLDGGITGQAYEMTGWRPSGDSVVVDDRYDYTWLTPSLRVCLPRHRVSWRAVLTYVNTDAFGGKEYRPPAEHELSLKAGPVLEFGRLLAAGAIQVSAGDDFRPSWWSLLVPAGIEWSTGPVVFRLGGDVSVHLDVRQDGNPLRAEFRHHTYLGLGLRPVERVLIDFVPDLDDAANLRGLQVAASCEF